MTGSCFRLVMAFLAAAFAVLCGDAAHAIREPRPLQIDHRVRVVIYQPDEVYKYIGHYRYQSAIEFGQDETILTISMGDSTAWMLNPNGYRLFLKPVDQDATTNMTVITNKRTYMFELHARATDDIQDKNMMFIMRFIYPDSGPASEAVTSFLDTIPDPDFDNEPWKYNFNYSISGTDRVAPIKIFDDGRFTYFQFRNQNADVPAFFWVDEQGNEAIINYRTRGDFIVVERVSRKFTLRSGPDIVCVFNEGRVYSQLPPGPPE